MAEIEQGIKIKQPVEGLPQPELTMTLFCRTERSEGIIVVAGFIPASVGDKHRPYGVLRMTRAEGLAMTPSFCHPERSEGSQRLPRGACPERDSSVASLPQNDKERRARNDKGGGVGMTRELI